MSPMSDATGYLAADGTNWGEEPVEGAVGAARVVADEPNRESDAAHRRREARPLSGRGARPGPVAFCWKCDARPPARAFRHGRDPP